ncbi:hypothetical protein DVH24_040961 [Malus domestica]|uniref:Uncharacterized protein n=1 Tax=Malus domestica TaxID=3750 RepID=A0A498ICL0_MALDO|nr:hypothetical protein DVH24_040961 [Malus domestica]
MQILSLVATKMKSTSFFIASPEKYSKWFITNSVPNVLLNTIMFEYFIGMRKRGQLKEKFLIVTGTQVAH